MLIAGGVRRLGSGECRADDSPTGEFIETRPMGEFDHNFDGVVTGIFHVVDAFELITTGLRREAREAEQATRIRSAVLALAQAGVPEVPAATRLVGLNTRRNTSVHREWLEGNGNVPTVGSAAAIVASPRSAPDSAAWDATTP